MDNSRTWSTDPLLTTGCGVLAFCCAGGAISTDAEGRLLLIAAAMLLAGLCLSDLLLRPRLAADPNGLTLRSASGTVRLPWERVDAVRAEAITRHGIRGVMLEIDAGDDLYVLSRRQLGARPEAVADAIGALRPRQ